MRTIVFWFFLTGLFSALPLHGQNWRASPYEVYGGLAVANYFGDIGGSSSENTWFGIRDINIARSRPGVTGGIRYLPGRSVAVGGSLAVGWLSGSDIGGRNESRDYVFNSVIFEPSARIEYFAIKDRPTGRGVNRRGMVRNYAGISAYLYGGLGAVIFHVMPNDDLAARQGRENLRYGSAALVLPAGMGMKIGVSNNTDLGFELGGRYVFNDYLDGFTSDSSASNDIYYLTSVQIVFRMPELRGR
jgi:hypothetical protein